MMKWSYIPLFFWLLTLVACSTENNTLENDTPEQYGESLLKAFKAQDPLVFEQLVPPKADIIADVESNVYDETDRKEMLESFTDEQYDSYKKGLTEQYTTSLAAGKDMGIDWSQVTFNKVEYQAGHDDFSEVITGGVIFKHKEREYFIPFSQCGRMNSGWYANFISEPQKTR